MSNPANTSPEQPQPKKQSATQRLDNLEGAAQSLFQLSDSLVKDLLDIKKALQLLNNKVDALAKAAVAGEEPNDEVLNRIMIENNIADLSQKVANMVEQGFLINEEEISDNAFVVGKELDGEDKVINPRLQFAVRALKPDMQTKLIGAKKGAVLQIQDNLKFHVLESYKIQQPQAPAPETTEATPVAPVDQAISEPTPV